MDPNNAALWRLSLRQNGARESLSLSLASRSGANHHDSAVPSGHAPQRPCKASLAFPPRRHASGSSPPILWVSGGDLRWTQCLYALRRWLLVPELGHAALLPRSCRSSTWTTEPPYSVHTSCPPAERNPVTRTTEPSYCPAYGTLLPGLRNPLSWTTGSIHLVHGTPSSLIQTTQTIHLLADAVRSQHDPNRIHNATTRRAALQPLIRSMYALVARR